MKKGFFGVLVAILIFSLSPSTSAAEIQIKVDRVTIVSDAEPEIRNDRMMVPLRVISENLGAHVDWSHSRVTLTKGDMKVVLNLNSAIAEKNGEKVHLDAKPYMKNHRMIVPLRFIAETFGCHVNYSNLTVTVDTKPLVIDGVRVKALQYEYHMTMGGVVQQVTGNAYNEKIHNVMLENKGRKVEAPASYSWSINLDTPGSYYKAGQYDFLDEKGNGVKRYDIYMLERAFPDEWLLGYPEVLIYDASSDQWHLFSDQARQAIDALMDKAEKKGFLKMISNTVA